MQATLATLAPPERPRVDSPAAPRPLLLVVDDDEGPRLSLQMVFQEEFEVLLASDGPQALAWAQQHPLDVVLLDLRLQGMSGVEIAERLKAIDPDVQIIIMTAYESVETARQAVRLGACDYLSKPFDLAVARTAVAEAVARRRSIRRLHALEDEIQQQKLLGEIVRTKNEIYAGILHDINGPLTFISGISEMLDQEFAEVSEQQLPNLRWIREQLAHVRQQANRCIELARRYLHYMQSNAPGQSALGLNQVFTDLEKLLKLYPAMRGNQLFIHLPEREILVRANGLDLIQILLNLTLNALQCTPMPHQVNVWAEMLGHPLDPAAFQAKPNELFIDDDGFANQPPIVAVKVQDDGPGVAPDQLAAVFASLRSADPTGPHKGLGLAIVNRCIKQNRGAIHIRSDKGIGTAVTVFLPGATRPLA